MKLQIYFILFFVIYESNQIAIGSSGLDLNETSTFENSTGSFSTVTNAKTSTPSSLIRDDSPISCFSDSPISEFQLPKLSALILKMSYKTSWKKLMAEAKFSQITFYVNFLPTVNIEPIIKFTFNSSNQDVLIEYCSNSDDSFCIKFENLLTNSTVTNEWKINKTETEIILQKSIFESSSNIEYTVSMFASDEKTKCNLAFVNFESVPFEIQSSTFEAKTNKNVDNENSGSGELTLIIVFMVIWILVILVSTIYLFVTRFSKNYTQMMAYESPFK